MIGRRSDASDFRLDPPLSTSPHSSGVAIPTISAFEMSLNCIVWEIVGYMDVRRDLVRNSVSAMYKGYRLWEGEFLINP